MRETRAQHLARIDDQARRENRRRLVERLHGRAYDRGLPPPRRAKLLALFMALSYGASIVGAARIIRATAYYGTESGRWKATDVTNRANPPRSEALL